MAPSEALTPPTTERRVAKPGLGVVGVAKMVLGMPLLLMRMLWEVRKTPPSPFLSPELNFGPVHEEHNEVVLKVKRGAIPAGLTGEFVRNGPNPRFPPRGEYHWFDGDGMLHGVHISSEDGQPTARFSNKFVRTEKFEAEAKQGRSIWHGVGDLQNPLRALWALLTAKLTGRERPIMPTANTSIEYHSGRFFALNEGDGPYHVRLPDLDTLGKHNFDGKLGKYDSFTAHPKVDPYTGEMLFFGYSIARPMIKYHQVSPKGELVKTITVPLPKSLMMHDFSITENYAVLFDFPLTFDQNRYPNRPGFMFEVKKQARIGLLPRKAASASEVVWFDCKLCFMYHVCNSWEEEEGNVVAVVGCRQTTAGGFPSSGPVPEVEAGGGTHPRLHLWRLDLRTGVCTETELNHTAMEFPTVNPHLVGRRTRFSYLAGFVTPKPEFLVKECEKIRGTKEMSDRIVSDPDVSPKFMKLDLNTGEVVATVNYPRNWYGGEPLFVPKDPSPEGVQGGSTPEDEGYVMTFLFNPTTQQSTFAVWDAATMDEAPLVELDLPQRVPFGFHSKWVWEGSIKEQVIAEVEKRISRL